MKNRLLILIILFTMCQFIYSWEDSGYFIVQDKVFYKSFRSGVDNVIEEVQNVDFQTFKQVSTYFGKDKNYVYYCGKTVKGIYSKIFEVVSWYKFP